ncbi:52 kDa repressor of the inhibitor of the protein kinase, partial [Vespula maculifrons]
MGKLCYLCNRKASNSENISLHSFPKHLTVRQKWLNVCGLNLNDDVSHSYICSVHFAETDINKCNAFGRSKSVIKPGAVPSMFITNPLVIGEVDKLSSKASANDCNDRCKNILSDTENTVEVSDKNCKSTFIKHKSKDDNTNDTDVASPRRAERVIKLIKATDQQKSKRIKNLQDQTRKLKKRVTFLQGSLKNKKMISEESGDTFM